MGMPSESDNLAVARSYLEAIERGNPGDSLTVLAGDGVQEEFPNRLVPQGARRDLAGLREAAQRGRMVMAAQRYEVLNAVASGDQVALEVQWTGTLAVPFGSLPCRGADAGAVRDLPGVPRGQDRPAAELRLLRAVVSSA